MKTRLRDARGAGKTAGRAGLVAVTVAALAMQGCATTGVRSTYSDPADACSARREPMIQMVEKFNEPIVKGAATGALVGALAGALISHNSGGRVNPLAVLGGAAVGGALGAGAGYLQAKQDQASSWEELLSSVDADARLYGARSSTLRNSITNLYDCRRSQIAKVTEQFSSGILSGPQAKAELTRIQTAIAADDELLNKALGTSEKRVVEIASARASAGGYSSADAYLGQAASWTPQVGWADPDAATPAGVTTMYSRGSVNVRSGPSTGNAVIGGLSQGQEVRVTGRAGNGNRWAEVALGDQTGYVLASLLADQPVAAASAPAAPVEKEDDTPARPALTPAKAVIVNAPPAAENPAQAMVLEQKQTEAMARSLSQRTSQDLAMALDLVG